MIPFNYNAFKGNPCRTLLFELNGDNSPVFVIENSEFVFEERLVIQMPVTLRLHSEYFILDKNSALVCDQYGSASGRIRLIPREISVTDLAELIIRLAPDQELYFKTSKDSDLYGIKNLTPFENNLILLSYYGGGNSSIYDRKVDEDGVAQWISEVLGKELNHKIHLLGKNELELLFPDSFAMQYGLNEHLQCPEEGWLVSDVGNCYEIQADDNYPEICENNEIAIERAAKRGIRFRADNPLCPAELIYD